MGGAALEQNGDLRPAWRILLERERRVTALILLGVAVLAWAYLLAGAGMPEMGGMDPDMVMEPTPWSLGHGVLVFLMWWTMMAAMMLPGAAPAILLYDRVARRLAGSKGRASALFAAGYLLIWGTFSSAAAMLHWGLDQSGLLTMKMASASAVLGGLVLTVAGLWQLSPVKRACLSRCQNPLQFLSHRWRSGGLGALRMGAEHGIFCLGCCWVLMGLLLYGGIMNFAWIGGLALYVLAEKTTPVGHWLADLTGWALVATGLLVLAFGT